MPGSFSGKAENINRLFNRIGLMLLLAGNLNGFCRMIDIVLRRGQ